MLRKSIFKDRLNRDRLSTCYHKNMVEFLMVQRNLTYDQADNFVTRQIKKDLKTPRIEVIETIREGKLKRHIISFNTFMDKVNRSIVTPSGSLYKPVTTKRSFVSALIRDGLKNRKKVKKKMFAAMDSGDHEAASKYKAEQNTIKVKLNALPGSFGSPSNLFYDKGGYNAVTASARLIISNSFTCAEQLLSANIPLYNVEEVINLIMVCKNYGPDKLKVTSIMDKYKLNYVTANQVKLFLEEQVHMYIPNLDFNKEGVSDLINTLDNHILQFIYYHGNLKHLLMNNDNVFRPVIDRMFDLSNLVIPENTIPRDYYECDNDIMCLVNTVIADKIKDVKLKRIVQDYPEVAKYSIAAYNHIVEQLLSVNEIMELFLYHNINTQLAMHRSSMQRKSVVVSDTDSVIYTSKDLAKWYVGEISDIDASCLQITGLLTLWLTITNANVMEQCSVALGSLGDDIPTIQMKNEYGMPIQLNYGLAKTYANIISVTEGVVLSEYKPDIKGAAIRAISASPKAKEFTNDVFINDILKPAVEGNISGIDIINKVVKFERSIIEIIKSGDTTFYPNTSVKPASDYATPDSSVNYYARFWNEVFAKKYGEIQMPDKLPLVKIIKPSELYLSQLRGMDKGIYDRFRKFLENNKRCPSAVFIEPLRRKIPPELLPLVDVRPIVYKNMSSIYLTLESLNLGVGFGKHQMLLSEVYQYG